MYDLFVSYRRKDSVRVLPVVARLRDQHGLRVWLDQSDIEKFESVTAAIREGLSQARAMLVWYSQDYPASRACQYELISGFTAALRAGDPRERILVINPEPGNEHVHPVELRDQNFLQAGSADADCEAIARKVHTLGAALGELQPQAPPPWFGRYGASSSRFVGRLPDLWKVHSALHGPENAIVAKERVALVQVRGLGGLGKTLLAEEYALRFGSSFPGGVFWLQAPGPDATDHTPSTDQLEAIRSERWRSLALELGAAEQELTSPGATRSILSARLAQHVERIAAGLKSPAAFLWVVDDIPAGMSRGELDRWLPPHPLGKVLITTRSKEHDAYGSVVDLQGLAEDEAVFLMETRFAAASAEERRHAALLAQDLGYLPLALEVAGATLQHAGGLLSYREYHARLSNPGKDALEFGARLVGELPTGHNASVAYTILTSLKNVGPHGLDLIRLAAQLAPSPIPSRLVQKVFALAGGLDEEAAREAAILSFRESAVLSLSEQVAVAGEAAQRVHPLISRTLRLYEEKSPLPAALRRAATRALLEDLPDVADARKHVPLQQLVLHARHLVAEAVDADEDAVEVVGWVARFDLERGNYDAAARFSRRQVEARKKLFGDADARTLLAQGDLARALEGLEQWSAARDVGELVLKGRMKLLGADHVDTLTAMNNLAGHLLPLGDVSGALALQKQVLDSRRRLLGENHDHTLFAINNYGAMLGMYGNEEEARNLLERAYSKRKNLLGADHPNTLASGSVLGALLFRLGEIERARGILRETVDSRHKVLGIDHPATLFVECALGRVLAAGGDWKGARALLEPTLERCRKRLGDTHGTTLLAMNNLGYTLAGMGELEGARELFVEALAGQRAAFGGRNPLTLRYAFNLFEANLRLGRAAEARHLFDGLLRWTLAADPVQIGNDLRRLREEIAKKYPDMVKR